MEEGRLRHAEVEAVHAWDSPVHIGFGGPIVSDPAPHEDAARALLDHEIASVSAAGLPAPITRLAVRGSPAWTLLETAKSADLVVVGCAGAAVSRVCSWVL